MSFSIMNITLCRHIQETLPIYVCTSVNMLDVQFTRHSHNGKQTAMFTIAQA